MNRLFCCAITALVIQPLWAHDQPPRLYRVISIGTLGGPPDRQMIDLGTLIDPDDPLVPATITEAVAINDRGEIALNGMDASGALRGYLLLPRRTEHEDAGSASDLARVRACSRDAAAED